MSRTPAKFTQTELARAVNVAQKCGMAVEVDPDGTIRIVPVKTKPENSEPKRVWVT